MPSKAGAQKNEWLSYLAECAKRYKEGHRHSPGGHTASQAPIPARGASPKQRITGKKSLAPAAPPKRRITGKQPVGEQPASVVRPKAKAKAKVVTKADEKKLNQVVNKEKRKKEKEAKAKAGKAK